MRRSLRTGPVAHDHGLPAGAEAQAVHFLLLGRRPGVAEATERVDVPARHGLVTDTWPASTDSTNRWARPTSPLKTAADNPYMESFDRLEGRVETRDSA